MFPFEPIKSQKYSDTIANKIKESIFDGYYSSGDRLPSENKMAEKFGVSNVTIRQAIRILEYSGIIYTKQGADGGIFVAEADTKSVSSYFSDMLKLKRATQSDLYMARLIFEPDVAHMVALVWRDGDLEEAEKSIRRAREAFQKNDFFNARVYSISFHRLIAAITRNPVIIFTLNSVIDVLQENIVKVKFGRDFILKTIDSHEIVLGKIAARKADEARDTMRMDIKLVYDKVDAMDKPTVSKTSKMG